MSYLVVSLNQLERILGPSCALELTALDGYLMPLNLLYADFLKRSIVPMTKFTENGCGGSFLA